MFLSNGVNLGIRAVMWYCYGDLPERRKTMRTMTALAVALVLLVSLAAAPVPAEAFIFETAIAAMYLLPVAVAAVIKVFSPSKEKAATAADKEKKTTTPEEEKKALQPDPEQIFSE